MPGMDGIELARRTRKLATGLPVVVLTGNAAAIATGAIESAIGGTCTVLLKPIRINELSGQITLALRRSAVASQAHFTGLARLEATQAK